LNQYT